jgi:aspartyl-tRNA(Asn)/glutamyl-tRNA(Gln) amidotransferase subunit B
MAEPYQVVIGLEIHVQLLTKTKLFCGCSTQFGLPPNSATCPVCLGLPGVLPVMNRLAFDLSLKAALALNCQIASYTRWDRKNYYYPDLPKNYQISQYDLPFSHDGWLDIDAGSGPRRIRIIRVHLEEDAGKMLHDESKKGGVSLVDLNRTGTPLLEIVSHPDIQSPEEARAYVEEMRLLMRELGVSDCEMQEGSLRVDANINLHIPQPDGSKRATPIVEVKNLNSIRAVERAMKYEAQRQYEEFQRTDIDIDKGAKATAGWDEDRGVTVIQRRKELAADYRYFPDPDLMPVSVDAAWLERIRADMGELPAATRARLQSQHGLSEYDAEVITRQGRAFTRYFEELASSCGDAKEASNWMTNQVLATMKEKKLSLDEFPLAPANLGGLLRQAKEIGLNKKLAGEVFQQMLATGQRAEQIIAERGLQPVSDESQLREIVRRAMAANPRAVADFKNGKTKAAEAIKGAIMRETRGRARIELVQQLLLEELSIANG